MFTKEDLLARLQNGDSVEDIATEMAHMLNEAEKDYKAHQEQELKVKAEMDRIYNAKREAVCTILSGLADFLTAAEEDELLAELDSVNVDEVVDMLCNTVTTVKQLLALKDLQFEFPYGDLRLLGNLFS